jgi:UDPglucose--hexose-1-phosphate uridylyltransferase
MDVLEVPHRRLNALTGRWVLVSPGRADRPWLGQAEVSPPRHRPRYDPRCYLCPGNERAGGERNPPYDGTFAFTNDFAGLRPEIGEGTLSAHRLLRASSAPGTCRVLCFSPRHDRDLAEMTPDEIRRVVDLWVEEVGNLRRRYRWVLVFENRGQAMGASNPHPHGQLWASAHLPDEPLAEDEHQQRWFERSGTPLLQEYAKLERARAERVVAADETWEALVPFWATWPFETLLIPLRHVSHLAELTQMERRGLALVLSRLLARYDNLFRSPFPYSMGWHGAPTGSDEHWQLHAHVYPPMLRSSSVRKFMAGYELLAEAQRDLTPEEAADRLRSVPDTHFLADTRDQGPAGDRR